MVWGGEALAKQGVELLYDAAKLSVVGLVEVFGHLRDITRARQILIQRMVREQPSLLILIDFPDFNLSVAKKAKAHGIPVLYYISPQVWAWRSGRVKTIDKLTNRIVVILPFEKDFYAERGVNVEFVGHPLLDNVQKRPFPHELCREYNVNGKKTIVGILPGSRKQEVSRILPIFIEAAKKIVATKKDVVFLLPLAPTLREKDLALHNLDCADLDLQILSQNRYNVMAFCDIVMAASGTVTLELAILQTPMVVAYKISPLTYLFGKRLIKVKYASLVNLVKGEKIVSELLQQDCSPEKINNALMNIWPGTPGHEKMKKQLSSVAKALGQPGAARRTALIALKLVHGIN